ncbi:MAG: DUF4411 family protein [Flammeovirgaceae bacterium]
MSLYVVDANFLIEAHKTYYPLDVIPSFWLKIKDLADNGTIVSIDKVRDEIYPNPDNLTAWCKKNLPSTFWKGTSVVLTEYTQVSAWTAGKASHYQQRAINEFMDASEADAWLVAYALHTGCKITTYEISNPARKNKIKIPEPCNDLGVRFLNTNDMFRELGITI